MVAAVRALPPGVSEVALVVPDFGCMADEACSLPGGELALADTVCALPGAWVPGEIPTEVASTAPPPASGQAATTPTAGGSPVKIRCVCVRVRGEAAPSAVSLLHGAAPEEHSHVAGAEAVVWGAAGAAVAVGSMRSGASSAATGVLAVQDRQGGAAFRCPFLLTEAKIELLGVSV